MMSPFNMRTRREEGWDLDPSRSVLCKAGRLVRRPGAFVNLKHADLVKRSCPRSIDQGNPMKIITESPVDGMGNDELTASFKASTSIASTISDSSFNHGSFVSYQGEAVAPRWESEDELEDSSSKSMERKRIGAHRRASSPQESPIRNGSTRLRRCDFVCPASTAR